MNDESLGKDLLEIFAHKPIGTNYDLYELGWPVCFDVVEEAIGRRALRLRCIPKAFCSTYYVSQEGSVKVVEDELGFMPPGQSDIEALMSLVDYMKELHKQKDFVNDGQDHRLEDDVPPEGTEGFQDGIPDQEQGW